VPHFGIGVPEVASKIWQVERLDDEPANAVLGRLPALSGLFRVSMNVINSSPRQSSPAITSVRTPKPAAAYPPDDLKTLRSGEVRAMCRGRVVVARDGQSGYDAGGR
jgi:hypothetical protein